MAVGQGIKRTRIDSDDFFQLSSRATGQAGVQKILFGRKVGWQMLITADQSCHPERSEGSRFFSARRWARPSNNPGPLTLLGMAPRFLYLRAAGTFTAS